jgi:predicted phosphoribosyltransferase
MMFLDRYDAGRQLAAELGFMALEVGVWYRDFTPVPDERVVALLAETRRRESNSAAAIEESSPSTTRTARAALAQQRG